MGDPGSGSCGCCAGVGAETPALIGNQPGQPAVTYRSGVHAKFRESLLARLSSAELPALGGLTTREDADFTIALCDALATTLDVLTFYQERIANESFLRTATERRSILELARLIGYELAPGVAASCHLAFTLQEVPGSPALAAGPVTIPVGTRVQSVPGPGEQPQTFETVEVVEARAEWNAIPVQASIAWPPAFGDTELWLVGVGSGVQVGDAIVIVGQERIDDPGSGRWNLRVVTSVEEDRERNRTHLRWTEPLGDVSPHTEPASVGATVHVFRQRARLFGHNAPDARLLSSTEDNELALLLNDGHTDWEDYKIDGDRIDLDGEYPKIVSGSWVALVPALAVPGIISILLGASPPTELYRAESVQHLTRRDYGLSAKTTRIEPDTTENLEDFGLRETLVLGQSEPLVVAETPLGYPLYGAELALGRVSPGLGPGRALALSGKRSRVRIRKGKSPASLELDSGDSVTVKEGDSLQLMDPPEQNIANNWTCLAPQQFGERLANPGAAQLRMRVIDRDGRAGLLKVVASAIELVPPEAHDEEVQEITHVGTLPSDVTPGRDRTTFSLAAPLKHCYDRGTTCVNANVVRATHGESVAEILGSGDARVPNASLPLRQAPLTFVSAATPSGRQSTLALRVNDLLWDEVDTLYERGLTERVYEIKIDDESRATVQFGDGSEGACPPSGDHNVRATYRKGLGLAGNVASGTLTNLLSRPLGVTGATNPEDASGGEDPETGDKARGNAPLTVLTLDRAVSIRDYRDFARAFAGIAKAHALWIPSGPSRGVVLTVAGEGGAAVSCGSDTYHNLQASLRRYGDSLLPFSLLSYQDKRFHLRLAVKVAGDADPALVVPGIEAELRQRFGFDARSFGQGVSVDEVAAVAQAIAGVEAVNVIELHRTDKPLPKLVPRLFASLPVAFLTSAPVAAELLTLSAAPVALELMS